MGGMKSERAGGPGRVGLDGFNLALEYGTGIATYARNLSFGLKALGAQIDVIYGRNTPYVSPRRRQGRLLREIGFFDADPPLNISSIPAGVAWGLRSLAPVRIEAVPISGQVISQDFRDRLPAYDRLLNGRNLFTLAYNHFHVWGAPLRVRVPQPPTIMHWTYPMPIELVGARNIYTVHDLVPLRLPHTTLDHKRRYLKLLQMVARRADHIVTVSENSRADILEILDVPAERVTNTYQATQLPQDREGGSASSAAAATLAGSIGVRGSYYLFFGAIEPKKNVRRLIEAFLTANVQAQLVIVGKRGWKSAGELQMLGGGAGAPDEIAHEAAPPASKTSLGGRGAPVVHLDYLPRSMLVELIRGARAVLFPSIYEGFGLPVLEAMQLGAPVITSNLSSLPEVAGDAALLVDPYDPRAIAAAIRRMEEDPNLRADLAARGRIQAEQFSPQAYHDRLRSLYGRLGVEFEAGATP